MFIMTLLAGLIATMFVASVAASLFALRHDNVNRNSDSFKYGKSVF